MAAAGGRRWKCGVCSAKAGDLVCGGCVTREADRRRADRAERLRELRNVREAAAAAMQARGGAVRLDARLQQEAADERRLKDQVREVTQSVAEERIKVAGAAFALKHHRDLLAAAESHISREQTSAVETREALLDGLRAHVEDAARILRQRRWRKVLQLFVLLPLEPSLPPRAEEAAEGGGRTSRRRRRSRSPPSTRIVAVGTEAAGGGGERAGQGGGGGEGGGEGWGWSKKRGTELPRGDGGQAVTGVSTFVDLPLPNNGDYSQVPPDVLMAALVLVARLVSGVASCLGVSLPHPLFPAASMRYATIAVDSSLRERSSQYPLCPLSKLAEIGVMGGASSVCNTVGAFETALDLLRSDVVHLCVEGGSVPVDNMWPAEALLLNLWELQQHAVSELRSLPSTIDVPLPMPRDLPKRSGGSHRRTGGGEGGSRRKADFSSASSSSPPPPPGDRRGRAAGMRGKLGFGTGGGRRSLSASLSLQLPQPPPSSPPPLEVAAPGERREENEEATYEFVGGGGSEGAEEEGGNGNGGSPGGCTGWGPWGSRLAAAGSGGVCLGTGGL